MSDSSLTPMSVPPPGNAGGESLDLAQMRAELGLQLGQPFNLGALLADRHCESGHGTRLALKWENHAGLRRDFTFDDLRRYSNAWAQRLAELGIGPGDRVCLFLDRVPDLYFAFLVVLNLGAVAQPLFSQFMADALQMRRWDAGTRAVSTTGRHVA